MIGQPAAGGALGTSLGAAISKWMGTGDYEITRNSLVAKAAAGIPSMHNTGQTVVVRHKEYVGQILGSSAFTVQYEFGINPANATLFPWLSRIARGFQEYAIKGMVYHYVPTSGAYSTSGSALGSVMIQTSYRANEQAPVSKQEMLNEYWANEVVPYETMAHPIECDPKENPFAIHYVRDPTAIVSEPLLYDMGRTFVATAGNPSTAVLGDLWVTYEIELKKPLVVSNLTPEPSQALRIFPSPSSINLFQNTPSYSSGALPVTFDQTRTMYLAAGTATGVYVFNLIVFSTVGLTGSAETKWLASGLTLSNCSLYPYFGSDSSYSTQNVASGVSSATISLTFAILRDDISSTSSVTVPIPTWTGGLTAGLAVSIFSTPRQD